jgi:adenosylcobinamide-GDP ribazoletransferase
LTNLFAAIRFITIVPAGRADRFEAAGLAPWFPVVGLLLGVLLALFDALASRLWTPPVVALLDTLLLAVLTGAFHLDGLADTADGLFSHRARERALEIMKDSRIGSMGVVALCGVLALKWAGISGLKDGRLLTLILVPAYARSAILFAMRHLDYGRPGGGIGLPFFDRRLTWRSFWAVAATVALSAALGKMALWLNLGFLLVCAAVIGYYKKRLGCVTGDMLGAITEVTEAGLFLIVSIGGGA